MAILFEADFKNGTTYHQGADDESIDTPDKNAFYDILQRMDEVVRFHLVNENGDRWTVDLNDGHFEHNGHRFDIHDQYYSPKDVQLIYFKEVRQEFNQQMQHVRGYVNRYFIGWQSKDEKHKHLIAIQGEL